MILGGDMNDMNGSMISFRQEFWAGYFALDVDCTYALMIMYLPCIDTEVRTCRY